jgi:3-oxoacyl-[acyl-carrier protein] reductase
MDLGLRGRTAIVCGASSGLGLAAAEALAEEGANVTMFARRREGLERDADRIGALAVRGDVTNAADLQRLVEKTVEAFGGIDVLVWNSGGPPAGKASEVTDEALEAAFELLLQPAVRLVRLCLPYLERSEGGRIVAVTSLTVQEPTPHLSLSNAIRPGLVGWLKTLSREVGPSGVTVNCVAPGRIDTPRMVELYGESGPPPADLAQIPLGRLGTPREFGDVVCFLASSRAAYVSGTTVLVDGGMSRGLL